jgi:para-aminobenzoate synthetase/4-amino-4-deoxychorismate lyase
VDITRVRFDDLSQGGSGSFGLVGEVGDLVARRLEEVVPVLQAAEAAARDGYWVAGFMAYEAAPALNPVMTVRPPGLYDPMRELPLARFQVFDTRIELEDIDSIRFPAGAYSVSAWRPDSSRH